jgi:hypothetical protein
LDSEFLKKAENYTMQIEKFVVNITPQINSITGPYFEIFARPDVGVVVVRTVADEANNTAAIVNRVFQPDNPKSTFDVVMGLKSLCDKHNGLNLVLNANQELRITMTPLFGSTRYLKFNPFIARLLNVAEYLYYFEDDTDTVRTADTTQQYLDLFYSPEELAGVVLDESPNNTFRNSTDVLNAGLPDHVYESAPVSRLDTRLGLDVVSSIGTDSKIIVLNEVERRKNIIGRFPIGEAIDNYNQGNDEVSQIINVGLEDMARNNSDTQTTNLSTGDIYVVNTTIEARFLEDRVIVTKDADFESSGFFYLQLLFSKRLK